jgi:hypothetical protein
MAGECETAMQVSSVGFAYDNLDAVMMEAKRSAEVTYSTILKELRGYKQPQSQSLWLVRVKANHRLKPRSLNLLAMT